LVTLYCVINIQEYDYRNRQSQANIKWCYLIRTAYIRNDFTNKDKLECQMKLHENKQLFLFTSY